MDETTITQVANYIFNSRFCIGQGNVAKVYQGYDQFTNKEVAIKQIERRFITNDSYNAQLIQNEMQILKELNHQNIVRYINTIENEQYLYIIMEYCGGGSLKDIIQERAVKEEEAIQIISQIINGFQELHAKGIMHRDLKPANILHDGKKFYKISDFGFAKKLSDLIFTGMANSYVGSPYYMSPQLLQNIQYSYKTDI